MYKSCKKCWLLAGPVIAMMPAIAHAHPDAGHVGGLASGLLHPFSGWDHVAVALAVGLWAAQMGGARARQLCLSFLAALGCGSLAGLLLAAPAEQGGALSIMALGLLLALAARPPMALALGCIAVFGVFQGLLHVAELPPALAVGGYAVGLVLVSVGLVGAGFIVGRALTRSEPGTGRWLLRGGGACLALGSMGLLAVT